MTQKHRDRVVELRRVPATEILPNPRNWREHPETQRSALRGLLAEIGVAGALIAYPSERADGALVLIDGHLRQEDNPETEWPVLVLDLTDAEADKLLTALDPLAGLATANVAILEELLTEIETEHEGLDSFFSTLALDAGIKVPDFEPADFGEQGQLDRKKEITCPSCGHEFTT